MIVKRSQVTQTNTTVRLSNGFCTTLIWKTSIHNTTHTQTNTLYIPSQQHTHTVTCTHRTNSVCLSRMFLTRYHETAAFCSWLLISSINSLPLPSTHPLLLPSPPLSSPLLPTATALPPMAALTTWLPIAMTTTCWGKPAALSPSGHHTVAALGKGKSITENEEDFLLFSLSFHGRQWSPLGKECTQHGNIN